jgi:hypothetical protein
VTKSGFYQSISFNKYLNDPAINSSGLKIFRRSPAKFAFWRDNDRPGTQNQLEGSALHSLILTPELFARDFGKSAMPRANSKAREKWDRMNPMARGLSDISWTRVHEMMEAFKHTPCAVAHDLLTDGSPELSIWFQDPDTGLSCKIRPDYLRNDDIMIDVKTTQNGSPEGFFREIKKWGYHYQAAFYTHGLNMAYTAAGVKRYTKAFIFIAIENFPPYEVAIYMLSEDIMQAAQEQIKQDLKKYKECLDAGIWPGYTNEIVILGEKDD